MKNTMSADSPNPLVCLFHGRGSRGGSQYAFISTDARVRHWLTSFATDCKDLDTINPGVIRRFLHLAAAPKAAEMYRSSGEAFLLEPDSLKKWLLYFKGSCPEAKVYFQRAIVYVAVSAVRFMMDTHPGAIFLGDNLVAMIRSKEFSTFVLDHWTGDGVVGVARTSDGSRMVMREFRFRNENLARLYCQWYESGVATVRVSEFAKFADEFEESIGDLAPCIRSFDDLSETTLLRQAAFFREKYVSQPEVMRCAERHVVGFYRYVIGTREGCNIFDDSNFSPILIKNKSIMKYITEGWPFLQFNDIAQSESRPRLVVLLRDTFIPSTRLIDGDGQGVDFSIVETAFYRNLLWRYVRGNVMLLGNTCSLQYIAGALHVVEEAKRCNGHPVGMIAASEVLAVKTAILGNERLHDATLTSVLGAIRRFVEWAVGCKLLRADLETVGNVLFRKAGEGPASSPRKAIPLEDVHRLKGRLLMESRNSPFHYLILTAVRLMYTTPFRPSQILKIDLRKVTYERYEGYTVIRNMTKTSSGDETFCITHPDVYDWLSEAAERTEEVRSRCYDKDLQGLLFITEGACGIMRIKAADLRAELYRLYDILDMEKWPLYSFRDLYATIAKELFGERAVYAMNHRNIKTLEEHYEDRAFEEIRRVEDAGSIGTDAALREEYERYLKGEEI